MITPLHVPCFSFHTSSGNGFEAFFTEEDILVVAVCTKKEFHTIAVADCPISDNEWVCIFYKINAIYPGPSTSPCRNDED